MNAFNLPKDWKKVELPERLSPYDILWQREGDPYFRLIGMSPDDNEYKIYEIPMGTKLGEIASYFQIGSQNAFVYGCEEDELLREFEGILTELEKIVHPIPVFADCAGLKLIFPRGICESEIFEISMLFSEENAFRMGVEKYFLEWDGQSPMLEQVKDDGFIHFWWD